MPPVTLYSQTEIQHVLDPLPAQDWPTAFGLTIHGERLFPAVVIEPLLAAHDAERLAAEAAIDALPDYLRVGAGR